MRPLPLALGALALALFALTACRAEAPTTAAAPPAPTAPVPPTAAVAPPALTPICFSRPGRG